MKTPASNPKERAIIPIVHEGSPEEIVKALRAHSLISEVPFIADLDNGLFFSTYISDPGLGEGSMLHVKLLWESCRTKAAYISLDYGHKYILYDLIPELMKMSPLQVELDTNAVKPISYGEVSQMEHNLVELCAAIGGGPR